jgi:predicted nucleic acid-binding protein
VYTSGTMKPTVYIETTIVSYLTCWPSRNILRLAHEITTRQWWENDRSQFDLFVSDEVLLEVSRGDATAAVDRIKVLTGIPVLALTQQAELLAEQLAAAIRLPRRARSDALHIAISAINGISYLLTWNCRHLANAVLAGKIEEVCQNAGYIAPRIVTPDLLMRRK